MSRSHWTNYEKNFMLKYFNLFFIETSYLYLCLKSNLVGFPKILQKSSPARSQYFASKLVNICIFIVYSFFFVQYCDKKCYVAKRSKSIHCHVVNYIIFFSLSFYSKQWNKYIMHFKVLLFYFQSESWDFSEFNHNSHNKEACRFKYGLVLMRFPVQKFTILN